MYDIIAALTSPGETPAMLDRILSLAVDLLGAERGLILLFPEDGGTPHVAAARNLDERETIADAITYSCQIIAQGRRGQSLVCADAGNDPHLQEYASVGLFHIRSVLCVPMRTPQRVMGTVYLDSRTRTINFDDDDLRFLEAFAQHAATALNNKRMVRALERENVTLRETLLARYSFANIVGRSAGMQEVFGTLKAVTSSS
jgi:GAF domain-containing protein